MKFSICIPTYEMHGYGMQFLYHSFMYMQKQTMRDFNVVVSDHSINNDIKNLCDGWNQIQQLNIKYIRNDANRGSSSANINNAMKNADGDWLKILFQDDLLYSPNSLQILSDKIDSAPGKMWMANASEHTVDGTTMAGSRQPGWNPRMHLGVNSIGSPTVITVRNTEDKPLFDESLIWLMDCDYYRKLFDKWGEPGYINEIITVDRLWARRLSNTISNECKREEHERMIKRYGV